MTELPPKLFRKVSARRSIQLLPVSEWVDGFEGAHESYLPSGLAGPFDQKSHGAIEIVGQRNWHQWSIDRPS